MIDKYRRDNPLNSKVPKYCEKCARKLRHFERKLDGQIDVHTGKPIEKYRYKVKCPRAWFLNCMHHSNYLIIETPRSNLTGKPHRTILEYLP